MKICASLIVRNELSRYLELCIEHLLEFVDEVRALDDWSDDGSYEWMLNRVGVEPLRVGHGPAFFRHEGQARNDLLDWTLEGSPDWILSLDADEFVTDGTAVRRACSGIREVFALPMVEVWEAHEHGLCVRTDGGWWTHPVNALWKVNVRRRLGPWRIADRALACGRVPAQVNRARGFTIDASILHFGWANEQDRQARYDRYVVADGGKFHRSTHLDSIMWDCNRVRLEWHAWPAGLAAQRQPILERAGG